MKIPEFQVLIAGMFIQTAGASPEDLNSLRVSLLSHLEQYLSGYIWQSDRFNLQVAASSPPPWHHTNKKTRNNQATCDTHEHVKAFLWGSISFGENIEDEWHTTWLLLELTRSFPVTARYVFQTFRLTL
jgi:SGT1 protein